MKDIRRAVGIVVIASFSIAALFGIAVLLGAGSFGETEGRVLLTTVIVGVESIAMLCYLGVSGHRFAFVGWAGAAFSLVATILALVMTWGDGVDGEVMLKSFAVSLTLAVTLAQACLLLVTAGRHRISPALSGTFVAMAVVAAMIIGPIIAESGFNGAYWRLFGVVAILDVLGTIVLTAIGAIGGRDHRDAPSPSRALSERITALAAREGVTSDELVGRALDEYERVRARES